MFGILNRKRMMLSLDGAGWPRMVLGARSWTMSREQLPLGPQTPRLWFESHSGWFEKAGCVRTNVVCRYDYLASA